MSGLRGVKFYAARLVFNEDASLGNPRIEIFRRALHRHWGLEVYPREDIVHTQDVRQQRQPELAVAARLGILREKPEFLELPCRLSLIVWFHIAPLNFFVVDGVVNHGNTPLQNILTSSFCPRGGISGGGLQVCPSRSTL